MNRGNPAEKNSQVMLRGVHLGHLCSICITPSSPSSLSASLLPPRFPRTAAAPPPTVLCHRVFQETCNQEMPSPAYFDDTHLCLLVWRGGDNSNFFHTGRAWNLKKVGNINRKVQGSVIVTSSSRSGSGVRGLLSGDFVSVDVRKVRFAA